MAVNQEDLFEEINQKDDTKTDDEKEPDTEAEDEVKAEDEEVKADDEKKDDGKGLPQHEYIAMKREREKWQKRMATMEDRLNKYEQLEEKLNQFYQEQASKVDKAETPDYDENPAEYLRFQQEQLAQNQKKLSDNMTEQKNLQAQMKKQNELVQSIQFDEARFLKEKPDYYKALNLVMEKELAKAKMAGLNDRDAQKALTGFVMQTASQKIDNDESPAEFIYELAKFYGYKNEETTKAEEKIDQLEEGMKASKNLGSGNKPNLDDLEKMELSEFDTAMKEMFG